MQREFKQAAAVERRFKSSSSKICSLRPSPQAAMQSLRSSSQRFITVRVAARALLRSALSAKEMSTVDSDMMRDLLYELLELTSI